MAVAAAYALAYSALRELTFSHWALYAGFRFSVLLFVPYRYWPSLLVAEGGSLAYVGITCADEYGWLWSTFFMVPPIAFAMPIVRWCRDRHRLFPDRTTTSMNVLLSSTFVVSLIWTAINMGTLVLMRGPRTEALHYQEIAGRYFIGNYLGILSIVPIVLAIREELLGRGVARLWARMSESRLVLEAASLLLPSLAFLVWMAVGPTGRTGQEEARIAMFLPVAWLALRHGWRGAAVGGTAASIAVVLTMPSIHDGATVQAQSFIAFATTTLLLLGGRIAVLNEREAREKAGVRMALGVAQRNIYLGELQLRQTSHALEQMSGALQASYTQLLGRLRCLLPNVDERTYYRHAAVTQHQMYRLADSLYPMAWRERGLSAALREGSMPRALDEAGIAYWCDADGDALAGLSTSLHMAVYRLTCEAVSLACAKQNISRIHVRLRCGSFGGRRWVVLRVDSKVDFERLSKVRWDDLIPALGGSGLGMGALKDRAAIFEGKVRSRSSGEGNRLSVILFDPDIC